MLKPAAAGLTLLALCLLPRDASAVALAGVSTSIGLAAALLALLAVQGGSPLTAAGALAGAGVLLLVLAALTHLAWQRRVRAPLRRHGVPPVLARVPCGAADRALLAFAREHFMRLQHAWDGADQDGLRALTTDCMFEELQAQLCERGPGPNQTDVLALDAHLISREQLGALEVASIEFCGLVRESRECGAVPFREVWMLTRSGETGGDRAWRLARQQSLL